MKIILFITMFCAIACFAHAQEVTKASAQLESKSGSQVTGTITFTKVGDDVQVVADVQNLKPGKHGIHIHEKGDCSAPDAMSAGGHFNPGGHQHGAPDAKEHHAGDLGNMTVAGDGTGSLMIHSSDLSIAGSDNSVVGHAIIVHEKADDFVTQPTGAAGGRIGCGVIVSGSGS